MRSHHPNYYMKELQVLSHQMAQLFKNTKEMYKSNYRHHLQTFQSVSFIDEINLWNFNFNNVLDIASGHFKSQKIPDTISSRIKFISQNFIYF